ncbi:MAG: hypothetical protein DWQ47_01145 [Acidobacteria bacterium]|nr:MAG: hypothetical protein DWQ32_11605 [Acidobacteriota bacterium]REK04107.1 MAG: hypothetical protein DWQ38_01130 [Acidobacteriota bacterium]REK15269.1 MAG: hypothetical protein DWQ43_17295 [Acidobacteriota bacterium]REK46359.1 MAG: hypothetical protein DWQ47_01145 [Acidobacteriota bacterium]
MFLTIAFAPFSFGQDWGPYTWENKEHENWWYDPAVYGEHSVAEAKARWDRIGSGAKAGDGFRGQFGNGGDTHGSILRLSAQEFVMARVSFCSLQLLGLTYGSVVRTEGRITLLVDYNRSYHGNAGNRDHYSQNPVASFHLVSWDNLRYLVNEGDMGEFGDYVGGFGDYSSDSFWLGSSFFSRRVDDLETDYNTVPKVPMGYEKYLKTPIDGTIIQVFPTVLITEINEDGDTSRSSRTKVSLDIGEDDGVKLGRHFRILGSEHGETVEIIEVGKEGSIGVIDRWVDDEGNESEIHETISVGWSVSTSIHK